MGFQAQKRKINQRNLKNKVLKSVLQTAPYVLLTMYTFLYIFSDSQVYANYEIQLAFIDTLLLIISIIGAIYHRDHWTLESYLTLATVVTLNILSEINMREELESYYDIYEKIIINHLILMCFLLIPKKNNDSMGRALV